jgi:hypothetical protein
MKKILFSIFDHSGNSCEPYRNDPEWTVVQIDLKHGIDILTWDYVSVFHDYIEYPLARPALVPRVGLILMPPCTDYALSGAKHFARKDADGTTAKSQLLVAKCKEIIDCFENLGVLDFWQLENPMSRIHTLNPWLGKPVLKFNPCDYAGFSDNPESDRYNKATWIWGKFNIPDKKRIEPIYKENPGWKLYGGKSERTKELRSITPKGFCRAFYEANH